MRYHQRADETEHNSLN